VLILVSRAWFIEIMHWYSEVLMVTCGCNFAIFGLFKALIGELNFFSFRAGSIDPPSAVLERDERNNFV